MNNTTSDEDTLSKCILDANDSLLGKLIAPKSPHGNVGDTGAHGEGNPEFPVYDPESYQIVFILLGWLSKLYEPKTSPSPATLEITLPKSFNRISRFRRYKTTSKSSVGVTEVKDGLTFDQTFGSFGLRLPKTISLASDIGVDAASQAFTVTASNVFYMNLFRVEKLKIDWVPDLTHHLDLDERSRTLRMFAHPSYCALICLSNPESTRPLNRLLSDGFISSGASTSEDTEAATPFDDYCREVLITLGVIFGQDKRSRNQALQHTPKIWREAMKNDELLLDLCTTRWHQHVLFDHLVVPPARANYSARVDFPFLGEKLLRLQEYMLQQSPNDFRTLVLDRRDPLRFWTFVLAVVLAGLSILVSIIQTIVAVVALGLDTRSSGKD